MYVGAAKRFRRDVLSGSLFDQRRAGEEDCSITADNDIFVRLGTQTQVTQVRTPCKLLYRVEMFSLLS